ncbi:MAG: bifunctional aspartate kinase/diaminopimelate decarboxylase [Woeseiaceae bacterium]
MATPMESSIEEASFESDSPELDSTWVVLKFGGTSVAAASNWATIAGLIRNRLEAGLKPVVVHSALKGISNSLEALLDRAIDGDVSEQVDAIREQHTQLAAELDLDAERILGETYQELEQLLAGIRLVREVSVRVRAKVMALGEIMATRLGAEYLNSQGLPVRWVDARDVLNSDSRPGQQRTRDYLSATCEFTTDKSMQTAFSEGEQVVLTQGFIASNCHGETVLLGRGGSDTSAAYFAARLEASRLEIWTDVPGMFTADPRKVPSARLLVALHYDEAQELASAGSSVLHPRCLSPLRHSGIPLYVRCTTSPHIGGTVVSTVTEEIESQVKGICSRNGLLLISMETVGMWNEAGFLARAFAVFGEHRVSVDLISTSETNVTVSIDNSGNELTDETINELISELETLCRVRLIPDCSAISLVGRKIRTILPRLAPALEVFEEEKIHLMSQAANDLNLSFVVERSQGERLVRKLHSSIIRKSGGSPAFGKSWEQLFDTGAKEREGAPPWWLEKQEELIKLAGESLNTYVYDIESVKSAAHDLLNLENVGRILYAMKANDNIEILQTLADTGVDFECVSPGEVERLESAIPDLDHSRILFTPNFAPKAELEWGLQKGLQLTLDNLYPLEAWPELFEGKKLFIRMDPGQGRGHHEHVKTAGVHSKFGVPLFELDELARLVDAAGATVIGIHAHSGSGVQDPNTWRQVAGTLADVAQKFPAVRTIDLGGGLGIPEKPGDKQFDLEQLDAALAEIRTAYPQCELWLEPGRYLVARAGVLLTRVTQVKGKGDMRYIGVGTGMNSLIRPALYGSYHEIVNLSRVGEAATDTVTVVGPICETGDRLGSDRLLPPSQENDVILIANTGAYGYVMRLHYNRRADVVEVII